SYRRTWWDEKSPRADRWDGLPDPDPPRAVHHAGGSAGDSRSFQESIARPVVPDVASSARTRPIKHENLKPCPLHGLATMTSDRPGRKSTWNCSSGARV